MTRKKGNSDTTDKARNYVISTVDTLVSQVTPLLGITPRESTQLQSTNTPEEVEEILGTRAFQRYVDTPIQTLDRIVVNQPKRILPLAQEAKKIAEEIRIEKINEQWAGIPREQLLNQSFNDQLNSIQILEQLVPLQLAKDHLPGDIIDILKRLCKANHIPHNQLYYKAENCADCYYSKVIETFVSLLKWQFADRQLLLVNTARSLKFLEEYADRQALIWQIFRKHENIPDDISDLHLHIDDFKANIQKEFNFLKEVTRKNVENFQTSLNLQQTYSAALCSHINNIYHKISEIQLLPHPTQHMNTGDIYKSTHQISTQISTADYLPKNMRKHRGRIVVYNTLLENPMNAKPLLYHNELQKKWIGQMQYQSRSRHNQTGTTSITYQYYHQDMRQILVKYLNWRVI